MMYANLSTRDLLDHLDTTYGDLTADDLAANVENMNLQWNPENSIEAVFIQVNTCRDIATDGGDPITEPTAVRSILQNFEASGVFPDAIRLWRARPRLEHTLANITSHFIDADRERIRAQTSRAGGFAAAAILPPPEPTANHVAAAARAPSPFTGLYYCWSHGCGRDANHTSATCTRQVEGHQTAATAANMLGGASFIQRMPNERAVYRRPERPQRDGQPAREGQRGRNRRGGAGGGRPAANADDG
jgi:hypothetical protein